MKITIKNTQNPTIIKFEFPEFITQNQSFEYKNIDEAKNSPLAQKLFYLPFVKTVYISANFIAVERFSIVEWDDVKEEVANEIEQYIEKGGKVILEPTVSVKKKPISIYAETTPNPNVVKFVANKMLTKIAVEYKNIDQTASSLLARELFGFAFVKEIFIDENYVSVTKYEVSEWSEVSNQIRTFITEFIQNNGTVVDESMLLDKPTKQEQNNKNFDNLDVTSQQIINILEEYVKPAVAADGGNIVFDSYNQEENRVKVVLQGACSGCPSSTFTLKNGIENMLKDMLKNQDIIVEAINA